MRARADGVVRGTNRICSAVAPRPGREYIHHPLYRMGIYRRGVQRARPLAKINPPPLPFLNAATHGAAAGAVRFRSRADIVRNFPFAQSTHKTPLSHFRSPAIRVIRFALADVPARNRASLAGPDNGFAPLIECGPRRAVGERAGVIIGKVSITRIYRPRAR